MDNNNAGNRSKFPWLALILGFLGLFVIFGCVFTILVLASLGGSSSVNTNSLIVSKTVENGSPDKTIAIIPVKGIIASETEESGLFTTVTASPQKINPMLEKALNDDNVKAVVIDMDTPGGEVLASDLIYRKVKEVNGRKPVVIWMGNQAASGGYYISSGATEIVAHPNTITGSIGVIMQFMNYDGLYDKVGIETKTFKSAQFKDNAELWKGNSELSIVYQQMIDETYEQFVDIVIAGRGLDEATVYKLADGRIYSGSQAAENGLVDSLGIREDAVNRAARLSNISNPRVVEYGSPTGLFSNLGAMNSVLSNFFGVPVDAKLLKSSPGMHMYYLSEPLSTDVN